MKRHNLYEIDLEKKIAFCTVCGKTQVYIANTHTKANPKVICLNKARERWLNRQANDKRIREEKPLQPGWKPRHVLSEIDVEGLRAVCLVCGPTGIEKRVSRGYTVYKCVTKRRNYMRKYRRTHYIARSSNPHALSKIDEEKQTAICAQCGPVKIEVWLSKKKVNRRCINSVHTKVKE